MKVPQRLPGRTTQQVLLLTHYRNRWTYSTTLSDCDPKGHNAWSQFIQLIHWWLFTTKWTYEDWIQSVACSGRTFPFNQNNLLDLFCTYVAHSSCSSVLKIPTSAWLLCLLE